MGASLKTVQQKTCLTIFSIFILSNPVLDLRGDSTRHLHEDDGDGFSPPGQLDPGKRLEFPEVIPAQHSPATTFIEVSGGPIVAHVADVDGDARPDVVVGSVEDSGLTVFINSHTTTGNFLVIRVGPVYPLNSAPSLIRSADMDQDGATDLVVGTQGGLAGLVLFNSGDGSIREDEPFFAGIRPRLFEIIDLPSSDGDMDLPDVIIGDPVNGEGGVFMNSMASGGLGMTEEFNVEEPFLDMSVGNFDGDSTPDVVTVSQEGRLALVKNFEYLGGESTLSTSPGAVAIAAARPAGSSTDHLFVAYSSGLIGQYSIDDELRFKFVDEVMSAPDPVDLLVGDFDGDGYLDRIIPTEDSGIYILMGVDGGGVDRARIINVTSTPGSVELADIDLDGNLDLISAEIGRVVIHRQVLIDSDCNRNGILDESEIASGLALDCDVDGVLDSCQLPTEVEYARLQPIELSNYAETFTLGDIDQDGADEVILAKRGIRGLDIYEMGQQDHPILIGQIPVEGFTTSVELADLDGDPHPDLLVGIFPIEGVVEGGVQVFWGRAGASFIEGPKVATDQSHNRFLVHDYDQDGMNEVIALSTTNNIDYYYLDEFTGSGFRARPVDGFSLTRKDCVLIDLNGDEHIDIVAANRGNDSDFRLLIGEGGGSFSVKDVSLGSSVGYSIHGVAVGDYTGDGIDDVITSSFGRNVSEAIVIVPGRGDGTLNVPGLIAFQSGSPSLMKVWASDLDGDGRVDIAALGGFTLKVFHSGAASPSFGVTLPVSDEGNGGWLNIDPIRFGDLKGDGVPDIVAALYREHSVTLLDGTSEYPLLNVDCDQTGVPDYCEIIKNPELDSDGDGRVDTCLSGMVSFIRGDVNADGELDVSDPIFTLWHMFLGRSGPSCMKSADVNDDGEVSVMDTLEFLDYFFLGDRPQPADPFDNCGIDQTEDDLSCESYLPCSGQFR